jgi:glycosyltransferase involved in cell wall biosynthesis
MSSIFTKDLIVVTPIYEDVEASSRLFRELHDTFDGELSIVAVDDGSVREPVEKSYIEDAKLDGVVLRLNRNVGHQRAISIGLDFVSEHIEDHQKVVVMDSDGEDRPLSIKELIEALKSDDVDIAVARRKSRVETLKFKIFYVIYKWLFSFLAGKKINFGNFMALKPNAVKRVSHMQELGIHVAATILSSKMRIETVALDRGPRYAGQSKMNFVGLVLHGFKGLMIFAEDVLVRVGIVSAGVAVLTIVGGIIATLLKVSGFATPGWFSLTLEIFFLIFMQTGTLTLMILMLTGVVKSSATTKHIDYKLFVDEILYAKS